MKFAIWGSRIHIIFLFLSICVLNLFLPLESIGGKINDSHKKNTTILLDLPYGTSYPLYASLQNSTSTDRQVVEPVKKEDSSEPKKEIKDDGGTQKEINKFVIWILGDNNINEFKIHMMDFGKNNLPPFLLKYYAILIEKTYTYPVIILFIILTLLLILNLSVVLLIMYFTNKIENYNEKYIRIYRNSYEDILRSYLFGEIEWNWAILKFKKLKKRQNRKILTDVLINFKENLRGEMDNQIPLIFKKLGLETDSLRLANSAFYFRRIEGLKALTNLDPENAKKILPNYLNDSHITVRTEAQISYVRLYLEKPFEFLSAIKSSFPRWTQLSSFYIFRLHQVPVPAFVDYLNISNSDVQNFCLRMIIFFQQIENASEIFKLLESKSEITRFLSIKAINDLRLYDGKQMIKDMYSTETNRNKTEIIKALKNIGEVEDFDFLESIIRSDSISLKTEACRSLYYVNIEGRERLNILNLNSDLKIDQFLSHVTDPRN